MKHYKEIPSGINFATFEEEIVNYWNKYNIFELSVSFRNKEKFIFYDGPPFANGLPHYGHLLTGFIKDTFARYQTMNGKKVERRFGWDCHGLPAEMNAEKELKISGRLEIEKFGVDKFNEHCKKSVMKYSANWKEYVTRQARWVDFENDYKTMDINFMESTIWAFKELYNKGLIYESLKVVPYSWACETPLSNFETRLDNSYRKKESKTAVVKFQLKSPTKDLKDILPKNKKIFFLVWTTTPWTLPSNLMLAVNKGMQYKAIDIGDEIHIAGSLYFKDQEGVTITGNQLIGSAYEPLFSYFKDKEAFKVLEADFVIEGEGTGIVHIAPGFGEDDFELCKKHAIEVVCPVDNAGKFTDEVPDFKGINVFAANDGIINALKKENKILKIEQYFHNYPHCWRTDTPLIYKAVSSWYIEVSKFKDRMMELNGGVNWYPHYIKKGLFGNWLEGAKDWAISRNRFFGTPIPVWKSDNPTFPRIDVYGSTEELEKDFGVKITDLHKPFIDNLTRKNPDDPTGNSTMVRVADVLDCWFESGAMPFAQVHYPFENKDLFENNFPADFITEYLAQTRGWFYTLFVISTALFDKAPFKNCVCHGVILDENGQKLSKRIGNYQDPLESFKLYGSDSMRFAMLSSSVISGGNLLVDKEGKMLRDTIKLVINPIWNALNFFIIYANLSGVKASYDFSSSAMMDRYIFAKSRACTLLIKEGYDTYNTAMVCNSIESFIETLNNWYIRRNRDRFLKGVDKQLAFNALYSVFIDFTKSIAPILPVLAEKIWQSLEEDSSVHLQDFVVMQEVDYDLIKIIDKVREVCNAALAIRNKHNIRIRQPLQTLKIAIKEDIKQFIDILKDELNIKEVIFADAQLLKFKLQLNLPLVGKRYPEKIKPIAKLIKDEQWNKNEDGTLAIGEFTLLEDEYLLTPINQDKYSEVLSSGMVSLDLNIDENLRIEGIARDLVRFIQQTRKEANLQILDVVGVTIETTNDDYIKAIEVWNKYIAGYTSSSSIKIINTECHDNFYIINNNLKIYFQS